MATIVESQSDLIAAAEAAAIAAVAGPSDAVQSNVPMFTCLSCSIGYPNPEDQRAHYRTDLHRYNMKRRVANLPPVRADVFNAKILERRTQEVNGTSTTNQDRCRTCSKSFASTNAFHSHLNSRKHKEAESRLIAGARDTSVETELTGTLIDPLVVKLRPSSGIQSSATASMDTLADTLPHSPTTGKGRSGIAAPMHRATPLTLQVDEDATEEEIQAAVDAKVASSRRIDPVTSCLFCNATDFTDLDASVQHMSRFHGFFVPEQDYLTDLAALMKYLADKICIGNICLYCNGKGRSFLTGEAVRKHMIDKSHCKVAYETEEDRLELSDFYDFRSSYPDAAQWEDVTDSGGEWEDGDEDKRMDDGDKDEEDVDVDDDGIVSVAPSGIRYGDNEFELVLPSGIRLGHRSMRRYYNQSLRPTGSSYTDSTSGRQVAHRLNQKEKHDPLAVEGRGGHVVHARNRGEAREAKKHISTYRDMARREHFKTQVGFKNNSQKHFRDPLLQ